MADRSLAERSQRLWRLAWAEDVFSPAARYVIVAAAVQDTSPISPADLAAAAAILRYWREDYGFESPLLDAAMVARLERMIAAWTPTMVALAVGPVALN